MPDDKEHKHIEPDIPELFYEASPEQILQRCLDLLQPLNELELKATIETGHKVVIFSSDNFALCRHYLSEFLRGLREVQE